ncbi:MAG: hypothetical protein AAF799_05330 [Myxococcota bacterium]
MRRRSAWTWWAVLAAGTGGGLALLSTVACDPVTMSRGDASGLLSGALLTLVVLLITD